MEEALSYSSYIVIDHSTMIRKT